MTGFFCRGTLCRRTVRRRDPCIQNTEETIAKYAVEANLFRLDTTNHKKKYPAPRCFLVSLRQSVPRKTVPTAKCPTAKSPTAKNPRADSSLDF